MIIFAVLHERAISVDVAGKHCGRPRVDLDLRPALALLREGRSLKLLQVPRPRHLRGVDVAADRPRG